MKISCGALDQIMKTDSSYRDASVLLPTRSWDGRTTSGTIVRAMSPAGLYWSEGIVFHDAVYVNARDLIFIASHFGQGHALEEFYTDFDHPRVEECRLYAALMLSLNADDGCVLPFPATSFVETRMRFDFSDRRSVGELEALLRNELLLSPRSPNRWLIPPSPPCVGGPEYEFRADPAPAERQRRIYNAIDVDDHLTMRGLSAYLRSQMLIQRTAFVVEGLYALFVSLDATFSLVLRQLRTAGLDKPSSYAAQTFIEQAFGDKPSGMRYFEEFYEDRIRALHPESRFGALPYLPLSMSEGYQLSTALRQVWRYLVLAAPKDRSGYPAAPTAL